MSHISLDKNPKFSIKPVIFNPKLLYFSINQLYQKEQLIQKHFFDIENELVCEIGISVCVCP